jgi:clan AA aspartic protease
LTPRLDDGNVVVRLRMGQFSVRTAVKHPADRTRVAEIDLFVDTGVTLSWVPRHLVERLDVLRLGRRQFVLADGGTIERETALVLIQLNGTEGGVTVVIAEPGDAHLLGATALDTLGFGVDPIRQQLIPRSLLAM